MASFYTTKVMVEVEVSHQFGPDQGIGIVTGRLGGVGVEMACINSVKVIAAESNYKLHSEPLDEMVQLDLNNMPR